MTVQYHEGQQEYYSSYLLILLTIALVLLWCLVGRFLRSAAHGDIVVPSHRTDWGLRSFAVAGPSSWNALPVGLRSSSFGLDTFAKHLKTHLFGVTKPDYYYYYYYYLVQKWQMHVDQVFLLAMLEQLNHRALQNVDDAAQAP